MICFTIIEILCLYLDKIRSFINKPIIKVITGMRRTGNSAILEILRDEFIKSGVNKENIIFVSFESMKYDYIENASILYKEISNLIKNDKFFFGRL